MINVEKGDKVYFIYEHSGNYMECRTVSATKEGDVVVPVVTRDDCRGDWDNYETYKPTVVRRSILRHCEIG